MPPDDDGEPAGAFERKMAPRGEGGMGERARKYDAGRGRSF